MQVSLHVNGRPVTWETTLSQTLADALRELEQGGLVRRTEYLEVPVRVEYAITAEGKTLIPILEQLSDWAEQRMKQEEHA